MQLNAAVKQELDGLKDALAQLTRAAAREPGGMEEMTVLSQVLLKAKTERKRFEALAARLQRASGRTSSAG